MMNDWDDTGTRVGLLPIRSSHIRSSANAKTIDISAPSLRFLIDFLFPSADPEDYKQLNGH